VQPARPVRTAPARPERAEGTPPVGSGHVLAQQPLPDVRVSIRENTCDSAQHRPSTPAFRALAPHGGAGRTSVRVQLTAAATHPGSNAATTSGPVPDRTGAGSPIRPICGSTKRTPASLSVRKVDAQTG